MILSFVALLAAYLIGAVSPAILYSRAKGHDVRENDFAGTSGMMRQFGVPVGIGIMVADILKGALAVFVAGKISGDTIWFAPAAATLGHCYPIWHGFKGGQGVAPASGALVVSSSLIGFLTIGLGTFFIVLHKILKLKPYVKLGAVPFSVIVTMPILLVTVAVREGGTALVGFVLIVLVMLARGVQVLRTPKPGA
jgi:acyl phosphate:glycerol-3-phosphate acyltransferase